MKHIIIKVWKRKSRKCRSMEVQQMTIPLISFRRMTPITHREGFGIWNWARTHWHTNLKSCFFKHNLVGLSPVCASDPYLTRFGLHLWIYETCALFLALFGCWINNQEDHTDLSASSSTPWCSWYASSHGTTCWKPTELISAILTK